MFSLFLLMTAAGLEESHCLKTSSRSGFCQSMRHQATLLQNRFCEYVNGDFFGVPDESNDTVEMTAESQPKEAAVRDSRINERGRFSKSELALPFGYVMVELFLQNMFATSFRPNIIKQGDELLVGRISPEFTILSAVLGRLLESVSSGMYASRADMFTTLNHIVFESTWLQASMVLTTLVMMYHMCPSFSYLIPWMQGHSSLKPGETFAGRFIKEIRAPFIQRAILLSCAAGFYAMYMMMYGLGNETPNDGSSPTAVDLRHDMALENSFANPSVNLLPICLAMGPFVSSTRTLSCLIGAFLFKSPMGDGQSFSPANTVDAQAAAVSMITEVETVTPDSVVECIKKGFQRIADFRARNVCNGDSNCGESGEKLKKIVSSLAAASLSENAVCELTFNVHTPSDYVVRCAEDGGTIPTTFNPNSDLSTCYNLGVIIEVSPETASAFYGEVAPDMAAYTGKNNVGKLICLARPEIPTGLCVYKWVNREVASNDAMAPIFAPRTTTGAPLSLPPPPPTTTLAPPPPTTTLAPPPPLTTVVPTPNPAEPCDFFHHGDISLRRLPPATSGTMLANLQGYKNNVELWANYTDGFARLPEGVVMDPGNCTKEDGRSMYPRTNGTYPTCVAVLDGECEIPSNLQARVDVLAYSKFQELFAMVMVYLNDHPNAMTADSVFAALANAVLTRAQNMPTFTNNDMPRNRMEGYCDLFYQYDDITPVVSKTYYRSECLRLANQSIGHYYFNNIQIPMINQMLPNITSLFKAISHFAGMTQSLWNWRPDVNYTKYYMSYWLNLIQGPNYFDYTSNAKLYAPQLYNLTRKLYNKTSKECYWPQVFPIPEDLIRLNIDCIISQTYYYQCQQCYQENTDYKRANCVSP